MSFRRMALVVALPLLAAVLGGHSAADEPAALTADELKTLVGPIALYPDEVLGSVVPATTVPTDVVAAARYVQEKGGTVTEVPADVTWDPSVQALLQFPEVLTWMNENLEWMEQMGYAVATQQADVLAAIQAFRKDAQEAGNLKSDDKLTVTTEEPAEGTVAEGDDSEVIVIESSDPEVVYVPSYDPVGVTSPGYPGWSFGAGMVMGALGAWAFHEITWGGGNHGGGSINVNNSTNFNGGNRGSVNAGPNRPQQWNARNKPGKRPGGGSIARPNQPGWNRGPGAGKPRAGGGPVKPRAGGPGGRGPGGAGGRGPGGGARPSPAPRVGPGGGAGGGARPGGGGGAARPGGGGGRPAGGASRPASGGRNSSGSGFSGVDRGSRTRQQSAQGRRSMSGGGRSGGGRSGGGGRGGGGRGGGGGRRR